MPDPVPPADLPSASGLNPAAESPAFVPALVPDAGVVLAADPVHPTGATGLARPIRATGLVRPTQAAGLARPTQAAGFVRPTRVEVAEAAGRTIPDLVGTGLRVLFSGINPSLYSAATGHHFARPGNRFWPALHRSGFTPRQLHPSEQSVLPSLGLGITNVVAGATARADELSPAELIEGGAILAELVRHRRPQYLAVLGVTAYRTAFGRPKATIGPQDDEIGGVRVWVLPNPSGLNAHYTADALATAFAELRSVVPAHR